MAVPTRNRSTRKSSGSRVAALILLVFIVGAVSSYFLFSPAKKTNVKPEKPEVLLSTPGVPVPSKPAVITPQPSVLVPPLPHKKPGEYPPQAIEPEIEKPAAVGSSSARLAIIIDDMGSRMSEARALAAINVPLTFAIIPGLHADKDVAAFAAAHTIETMIHIPMQSKGWPAQRLEANGLLAAMGVDEVQERMSGFVQQFPAAVGANNHMGSEFTEREEQMTAVLQILKKNDLFFIDSVTSPQSTGISVAQHLGIKSARRNVFLDNEQERGYILGQLNQAIKLARKNGSAIAICHPHRVTIATLASALPGLAGQGVRLVPVSQLVR